MKTIDSPISGNFLFFPSLHLFSYCHSVYENGDMLLGPITDELSVAKLHVRPHLVAGDDVLRRGAEILLPDARHVQIFLEEQIVAAMPLVSYLKEAKQFFEKKYKQGSDGRMIEFLSETYVSRNYKI